MRAVHGMVVPGMCAGYALATPDGPHRPAVLAVALVLAVTGAVRPASHAVAVLHLLGAGLVTLLDGGVGSPAGAMLPFTVVLLALRARRPRPFVAVAAVAVVAYAALVLIGGPGPPGYAPACALGFGGVSYLCLRHAAALASLRRRLARVSSTDPLTGALNRRGFDERVEAEFAVAVGAGRPMTLLLFDLDLFKQVNDVYGHQAGDHLLASTAARLTREIPRPGEVGRIGGDEFAAVLPDAGPTEAAEVVRRLRAGPDAPAASVGQASFPADGTTLDELRRVADARVYQDKQSRQRRPASASAVAAAHGAAARPAVRVSGSERRRRSLVDIGWMSMLGSGCGLAYVLGFAAGQPHRWTIALLAGLLGAAGAAFVLAAGPLSRYRRARDVMFLASVVEAGLIGGMSALDGGVTGVCALALLVPMPLIALSSPLRVSVPVAALFAVVYLAVAALAGAPGAWYVALHLGGTAAVSAVCAVQGRAAGRQRRRLTVLSRSDGLTGVLNRRGFEQRCADELGTGRPAALLIVDLDGFKLVNDRHGHEAGDDLLRWVAATLTANLRPHDAVGRFGGDEFVALLTADSAEEAPEVAGRLRAALAARTGASIGVALHGRDGDDLESLCAHADAGLYAEKKRRGGGEPGRRVRMAIQ